MDNGKSLMNGDTLATLTLKNYKEPLLPHTGGIGRAVVIGLSVGAVLIGGLIIFLATRKKKEIN